VSCDAGRGELQLRAPHFLPWRIARAFDVVHRRAQDAGRTRLHEWAAAGRIRGFVMAYLGMRDERLPEPIADLITRRSRATARTSPPCASKTSTTSQPEENALA
jgi:NTE family protein